MSASHAIESLKKMAETNENRIQELGIQSIIKENKTLPEEFLHIQKESGYIDKANDYREKAKDVLQYTRSLAHKR